MSQANVELIQRMLGHYAETGQPDFSLIHDDVEVHDHDILDAGDYRGHDGLTRWLMDWASAWGETTFEPQEWIDADKRVVVVGLQRVTGKGSGVAIERQDAITWTIRERVIVRIDYYNNRHQALDALGLAP
jgi:ketosteroid isomerase-like protein